MQARSEQIVAAHAGLILNVVATCNNRDLLPQLEPILQTSYDNGWTQLVDTIRKVLSGHRDPGLLQGLDEEDRTIVEAILRGLQDPATLPDPNARPDAGVAAPGLAAMIQAASRGDPEALEWIGGMAEQMTDMEGDMRRLGGMLRRLVHGERDLEILTKGMGAQGEQLVKSIVDELQRLNTH